METLFVWVNINKKYKKYQLENMNCLLDENKYWQFFVKEKSYINLGLTNFEVVYKKNKTSNCIQYIILEIKVLIRLLDSKK